MSVVRGFKQDTLRMIFGNNWVLRMYDSTPNMVFKFLLIIFYIRQV
jgi:hypothetical protein